MSRADLESLLREGYAQRAASVSEAALPPAPTDLALRKGVARPRRPRWIAPVLVAAAVASIAVGITVSVSSHRNTPGDHSPSITHTSTQAPTPTIPASDVLEGQTGNGGGTPGDGTYIWYEEVRNISRTTVKIDGSVIVTVPPTVPMRVVAAQVGINSFDFNPPTPITSIKPGEIVDVWVTLHVDCAKVSKAHGAPAPRVIESIKLVGYTGSGSYPVGVQSAGGPSLAQQACGFIW